MKILVTGASGYIGQRLIPSLIESGHEVTCMVRDRSRFNLERYAGMPVSVIEGNLLDSKTLLDIPPDIDAAYYLVHSMSSRSDFATAEKQSAGNFVKAVETTACRQIIYLTGIINDSKLSKHLKSRARVERELGKSRIPLTALRAGIIVGSGSASFEIIRDLVEKLPVMIAPKWLKTKCQPVAIRNVVQFLTGVLTLKDALDNAYDIYGPDVLTYRQMLELYAKERNLKRYILTVPVMTPRLSSYWLYFVTSTSYQLAKNLVDSMRVDVVAQKNDLPRKLNVRLIGYPEAIRIAFDKIEQNLVLSTWKDSVTSEIFANGMTPLINIPEFGCFKDRQKMAISNPEKVLDRIFAIGGESGWYYANWLWEFRGLIDKVFGGVGLNRGRKHRSEVANGDTLDFWRVIFSSRRDKRLLLYAEMKLPGEAWLEFRLTDDNILEQTATFRPKGIGGRLYWYAMWPFHLFLFKGMMRKIGQT